MKEQIYVQGLRELQAALKGLDGGFDRELGKTNKKAAQIVVDEAKPRVRRQSGTLASSVRALGSARRAQIAMGRNSMEPYTFVQEFGWPGHGITPMRAIYGSIATTRDEVIEAYGEMVDDLTKQAFPN